MYKYFLFSLILLFLIACKESSSKKAIVQGERICINPKRSDLEKGAISMYIDSVEYIPLETNDSVLVGKIKSLCKVGDKFYIHDQTSDVVFIFDQGGHFYRKIADRGRGPHEYQKIDAFHVSPYTRKVYIFCAYSHKIIQYDSEGNYETVMPCEYNLEDFVVLNADSILMYGGRSYNEEFFKNIFPEQYRLVLMAGNNRIVNQQLKGRYENIYSRYVTGKTRFFHSQEKISLLETIGNTIYKVDRQGNSSARYFIDFGKYNLEMDFGTEPDIMKEMIKNMQKGDYAKINSLIEGNNIMCIFYSYGNYIYKALYYKNENKLINAGMVWGNDKDFLPMPALYDADSDYFWGTLESYTIKRSAEKFSEMPVRIKKLAASLKEMDNPCIVKIKFKNILYEE